MRAGSESCESNIRQVEEPKMSHSKINTSYYSIYVALGLIDRDLPLVDAGYSLITAYLSH
jgi:hypothetical protein